MRRFVIIIVTLTLLLTITSAAFASQSNNYVIYGNVQAGSISNGYQGYSWNHSGQDRDGIVKMFNTAGRYYREWLNKVNWHHKFYFDRDTERYYYIDANGVEHYFYLDPDRDYEVVQYKDENGVTQFAFKDKGRK